MKKWILIYLAFISSSVVFGAEFNLKLNTNKRTYGPFSDKPGSEVKIDKTMFKVVAARHPGAVKLKEQKSGRLYGPVKIKDGARMYMGRYIFTVIIASGKAESKARKENLTKVGVDDHTVAAWKRSHKALESHVGEIVGEKQKKMGAEEFRDMRNRDIDAMFHELNGQRVEWNLTFDRLKPPRKEGGVAYPTFVEANPFGYIGMMFSTVSGADLSGWEALKRKDKVRVRARLYSVGRTKIINRHGGKETYSYSYSVRFRDAELLQGDDDQAAENDRKLFKMASDSKKINKSIFAELKEDASDRRSDLHESLLVRVLGLQIENAVGVLAKEKLIADPVKFEKGSYKGLVQYHFLSDGVIMNANSKREVVTVEGHRDGSKGSENFRNGVPLGLTWEDTAKSVRQKLGSPIDSGSMMEDLRDGLVYKVDDLLFVLAFSRQEDRTIQFWRVFYFENRKGAKR